MEYASWLAGERWSDHPACTHPLLSAVARLVNDHTSDPARSRLVGLIPSVVGLDGDDPMLDVMITVRCAASAIPIASEPRQRALAVVLQASLEVLATLDRDPDSAEVVVRAREGLGVVPLAARWAEEFSAEHEVTLDAYRKRSAPAAARLAVVGIAEAAVSDRDQRLHDLLVGVIDDSRHRLHRARPGIQTARGREVPATQSSRQ